MFPELFFALFLNVVYVKGILDISLRRQARWHHDSALLDQPDSLDQPQLLEAPVAAVQA